MSREEEQGKARSIPTIHTPLSATPASSFASFDVHAFEFTFTIATLPADAAAAAAAC